MIGRTWYFPRLEKRYASELLGSYSQSTPDLLTGKADVKSSRQYWYPTAPVGERVPADELHQVRDTVFGMAQLCGYPGGKRPDLTRFDRTLTATILDLLPMIPSEAADEGVWSFVTLVLLPDVAFWRYPNRGQKEDFERIIGKPRNVFRRLWWRAYILGGGEDGLGAQVLEDEAVGILERTRLGGDPRLARRIAAIHLRCFAEEGKRTDLLRDAMKRISRLRAFVSLHALSDAELADLVADAFADAGAYLLTDE